MQVQELPRLRLASQAISQPKMGQTLEILRAFVAIQGQDYSQAKWALALRSLSNEAQIETLIEQTHIVRTWLMRGTLHLLALSDLRWMLDLFGQRLLQQRAGRHRDLELDDATFVRSRSLLEQALSGGKRLDRRTLLALLEGEGISTAGQRGIHILQQISLQKVICQLNAAKNNPLFVLIDEICPPEDPLPNDEALQRLALNYFRSRGPATLQDFVFWSSLPLTACRRALERVASQLQSYTIDELTYWMDRDLDPSLSEHDTLYLLPGFDEYLLGYGKREAVLDPRYAKQVVPGGNGVFFPIIVKQGAVVGTWKRSLKKDILSITTDAFEPTSQIDQAALQAAADRYASYLALATPAQLATN
jgi:hypothetical protein